MFLRSKYGIYVLEYEKEFVYFDSKALSIFVSSTLNEKEFSKIKNLRKKEVRTIKNNNILTDYLTSLTLCVSTGCNLRCKYCYANEGSYNRKFHIMTFEHMKEIFIQVCNIYKRGIGNITFFGGEPLLGKTSIIKFAHFVEDYCLTNNIEKPTFSIVTNGTLIDNETLELFNKYHFLVTISIDGIKEVNDENRIYKNSTKSVFDTVKNNLNFNKNARKFFLACESTLSPEFFFKYETSQLSYYLKYIEDLSLDFAIPFVAEGEQYDYNDKHLLEKIRLFYNDLMDYYFGKWMSNDYKQVPPPVASRVCQIVKSSAPKKCIAGKRMFFVDSNYDVYPCQMFYNKECRKMFNLNSDDPSFIKNTIHAFELSNRDHIKECKNCIAEKCCTSWCPGASINYNNTENSIVPIRCFVEKILVEKCIKFIVGSKKKNEQLFVDNLKKLSAFYSSKEGYFLDV